MSLEDARERARKDPQRLRLEARWIELAKTDPHWAMTWALAKRAGFEWYDTESAARQMADHAAGEILALLDLLKELTEIEGPQPGHVDWYRKVQSTIQQFEPKL